MKTVIEEQRGLTAVCAVCKQPHALVIEGKAYGDAEKKTIGWSGSISTAHTSPVCKECASQDVLLVITSDGCKHGRRLYRFPVEGLIDVLGQPLLAVMDRVNAARSSGRLPIFTLFDCFDCHPPAFVNMPKGTTSESISP